MAQLSLDSREFGYCRLEECSINDSPTRLARIISENVPVVFRNGISCPAIEKWKSNEYLSQTMGDQLISVAVTPNGRADAILDDKFVLPTTMRMTLAEFFSKEKDGDVYYIQSQNSSLTAEFSALLNDLENGAELPSFAKHIFGTDTPEAVNIWMGGSESVTTLHKDHYGM
jgi:jumonji domain-containing protein 7